MVYLKWLALMPASFIMAIVGRLLAPILPFFVDKETHRLPRWLSWFATDDNDADGDAGHWERWPGTDPWSTYKRRLAWLLRNVCYGFDIDVLGVRVYPTDDWEVRGNEDASDTNGVSGTCIRHCRRDGKHIAFQLYYIKHYRLFGRPCCVRANFGWKLWASRDKVAQYVGIYFNPIKGFDL